MANVTIEQLTFLLTAVNSTVLAVFFVYLRFSIEKRLKKYEYAIGDAGELNRKIHDRLVVVKECITKLIPIPDKVETSLNMNASRMEKYDSSISKDVQLLLKTWKGAFFSEEKKGSVKLDVWSEKQKECFELIKTIKKKVDSIVK